MSNLPPEEPVIKVAQLAVAAKRNGWHGSFDSNVTAGVRDTILQATRNDESIVCRYKDNTYSYGTYTLFDREYNAHCASVIKERLEDWPDILKLFKEQPTGQRPRLVNTYRRLPFSLDDPDNASIIKGLIGHRLYWYSHEYAKMYDDMVLPPTKAKSKQYRIVDLASGSRKMFHFIGSQAGFRSVILDTVIKVA